MNLNIQDFNTASKNALLTLPNVLDDIITVVRTNPDILLPYVFATVLTVLQLITQIQSPVVNNLITVIVSAILLWGNAYIYISVYNTLSDKEIREPQKTAFYRIPTLFGALVASTLMIFAGFILFMFPGFYLSLKLSITAPASVVDTDSSILSALQTSYRETHGHLILLLTVFGAVSFVTAPLVIFTTQLGPLIAVFGLILIGTIVIAPLIQIVAALLYVRLRQENQTL